MVTPENSSDKEMFSVLVGLVLSVLFHACGAATENDRSTIGVDRRIMDRRTCGTLLQLLWLTSAGDGDPRRQLPDR